MSKVTRRTMLGQSALLMGTLGAGLQAQNSKATAASNKKIVVVGAHPDDPESGCGGVIARYSSLGHEVVILYFTRGEAGIEGRSLPDAAAIRTAEAEKACAILNARPLFVGQIDGSTEISRSRYEEFAKILNAEAPAIVFTHWPIDSHRDHRAASLLTYDAWLYGGKKFDLYYYEVDQGEQTQLFNPTDYVDISETESRKRTACFAHASQKPETSFWPLHDMMNRFRGMECGVKFAEAFVRQNVRPAEVP